jgi:hypothetical protein
MDLGYGSLNFKYAYLSRVSLPVLSHVDVNTIVLSIEILEK